MRIMNDVIDDYTPQQFQVHFCILILKESSAHDFKNVKMMIKVMFHKLIIALGYGGKKLINSECILAFNVFVFGQANYRM